MFSIDKNCIICNMSCNITNKIYNRITIERVNKESEIFIILFQFKNQNTCRLTKTPKDKTTSRTLCYCGFIQRESPTFGPRRK